MEFTLQTGERAGRVIVSASGELDVHSAPELEKALEAHTRVAGSAIVVDLSDVPFMDSTGLGVIVTALKHVRENNGSLDVVVSTPRVRKVFALTGLDAVIPLHATLDEAVPQA